MKAAAPFCTAAPLTRAPSGATLPRRGGRENARRVRRPSSNLLACLTFLLALLLQILPAQAGQLDRAALERYFPPPLVVGEKDATLPIWPILKQQAGSYEVFAYAFESVDLAPIPGFGGTPPDLLVALAPDGTFRDVKVISQHEPVFLEGLGPEPLFAFVEQYAGLSAGRRSGSGGRTPGRGAPRRRRRSTAFPWPPPRPG